MSTSNQQASYLYDDFGNYIGPELGLDLSESEGASSSEESGSQDDETQKNNVSTPMETETTAAAASADDKTLAISRAVEPHELKEFYPRAEEVYGAETEIVVQVEDTQPITQPIITPMKVNNFDLLERCAPVTSFSFEFVSEMMKVPSLIRQFAVVGHLQHGKTLLVDMLVKQTHEFRKPIGRVYDAEGNLVAAAPTGPKKLTLKARMQEAKTRDLKYTDTRIDEQERNISIKATPLSLILPDSMGKSYLCHLFDTPGHINFLDEACAALRISDGALLVVDALEGMMLGTEKLIERLIQEHQAIILVINSIDRLILELRIPPVDAYFKLRYIIDEINARIDQVWTSLGRPGRPIKISPRNENVVFSSADLGFVFTCQSFAKIYHTRFKQTCKTPNKLMPDLDLDHFAKLLWGDLWFNPKTLKFNSWPPPKEGIYDDDDGEELKNKPIVRSFVYFVLEPLYKLIAHGVAEERPTLEPTLAELGIYLEDDDYHMDTHSLLRKICKLMFGDVGSLVSAIVRHIPAPTETAKLKVAEFYTGNQTTELAEQMKHCDADAKRTVVYTTKNYHRPDSGAMDVFGRVMSGTLRKGDRVKVLGQMYSLTDDEDMLVREVSHLWIYEGRYRIEVQSVPVGNWCLIGGIDTSVKKVATIVSLPPAGEQEDDLIEIFAPLNVPSCAAIKVACEPITPSELPKMLEGLRKVEKSYPLLQTGVEESGEHIMFGTGELYLDCALHDLREVYGDVEVRVSDPSVKFCETAVESSALKAFAKTPNMKNKISMICESLEPGVAQSIETGTLRIDDDPKEIAKVLTEKFEWDRLAASSVWAFGPDTKGPNVLLNDILDTQTRKSVGVVREFLSQGFQWAVREGPLIEEPVRNTKFRILDCSLASEPIHRGGGQIIPTARRVAYSSFLLATPRLMEPMYFCEIMASADVVQAVIQVLEKRRGHVVREVPKPGTPFMIIHAYLPAIDSFGFEVDIRTYTANQAFILSTFDHWSLVPGDPLDNTIVLRPLEPAPGPHLAREFLVKTRRRKGLTEDVSIQKFFDEDMLAGIADTNE